MQQEQQQYSNVISFPKQKTELVTASIIQLKDGLPEKILVDNRIASTKVVGVFNSGISWSLHDTVKVIVTGHCAVVYENMALFSNKTHEQITLNGEQLQFNHDDDIYIKSDDSVIIIKPDGTLEVDIETLSNKGLWCINVLGFRLVII